MVDSTQSVSAGTLISSRTQDQHNQVLLILCSLLSLPSCHFFALGGTPFLHKDTLGSFVFCLACDLLCFLFVFCLAAVKERVDQGPAWRHFVIFCHLRALPEPPNLRVRPLNPLPFVRSPCWLDLILVLCFENSIFFPAPVLNNDFVILAAENVLNFQLSIIQLSLKV